MGVAEEGGGVGAPVAVVVGAALEGEAAGAAGDDGSWRMQQPRGTPVEEPEPRMRSLRDAGRGKGEAVGDGLEVGRGGGRGGGGRMGKGEGGWG